MGGCMVCGLVDGRVFLLTFDCLLKAPQPVTGLFLHSILCIWKFHNSDNHKQFSLSLRDTVCEVCIPEFVF